MDLVTIWLVRTATDACLAALLGGRWGTRPLSGSRTKRQNFWANQKLRPLSGSTFAIAINQDSLGKQAELALRSTKEEWDLWVGELPGSRLVVGISNWRNNSQTVEVDLGLLGVAKADARDPWAGSDIVSLSGAQTVDLVGHEMKLWILSNIESTTPPQSTGYYSAVNAKLTGSAVLSQCGDEERLPIQGRIPGLRRECDYQLSQCLEQRRKDPRRGFRKTINLRSSSVQSRTNHRPRRGTPTALHRRH
ncbi:hypothetical protein B0J13DRAFT_652533 [Dactylonectria estremocensis]|uniref:Alpha galactosidase C-terminal domain-containing protein n=1 Tax=Dactylonectria estremocensis TaxID=1079267 RepID=A0A9P9IEU7_9HYPO|nr:hypothetical protein B0J13DRAFT_652533 [Dactylonectria estremocensis]